MKVTAIVGTYRKGGMIDQAVDAILDSARETGAETAKIYLIDRHVEFCTNCRSCTQIEGEAPGVCPTPDEMHAILNEIAASDTIILASPMNFGTVNAITKRFIERLVCFAYWPWGRPAPKIRPRRKDKPAVVVASSAAPAILARPLSKMVKLLKDAAGLLGGHVVGVLFIGLAAQEQYPKLPTRAAKKAHRLGKKLVQARR